MEYTILIFQHAFRRLHSQLATGHDLLWSISMESHRSLSTRVLTPLMSVLPAWMEFILIAYLLFSILRALACIEVHRLSFF